MSSFEEKKLHCCHYKVTEEINYVWHEKPELFPRDLYQSIKCKRTEIFDYIQKNIQCEKCKINLIYRLANYPSSFFNFYDELYSEYF